MEKLREFVFLSKYAGMREDLIQAGGGNSSVKVDNSNMYIKSSGYLMSDINEESGYSIVNYQKINSFFNTKLLEEISISDEAKLISKCTVSGAKPSIETFLHSITDVFTLHTHPIVVNIMVTRNLKELKKLFPNALYIDYAIPGIALAKEYFKEYNKNKKTDNQIFDIIFLKNHGLVVSGKSAEDVIEKTENVIRVIERYLNIDFDKYHSLSKLYVGMQDIHENNKIIYLSNNLDIKRMIDEKVSFNYAFCPDAVVYLGKKALVLDNEESSRIDMKKYIYRYGQPIVIVYKNEVYIQAVNLKKAKEAESVLAFCANVLLANKNIDMDILSEEDQNLILGLESEKYRQSLK